MPNFGYETIGSLASSIENYIKGSVFQITEDGTGESITVALAYGGIQSTWNIKCAIYKHSDSSFVAETEERAIQLTATKTWYTFNFSDPKPSLTADTDYVLVAWANNQSGDAMMAYANFGTDVFHADSETYNSFPSTASFTHGTGTASIYCTYSTGGATYTKTFAADALLQKPQTKTLAADAFLQKPQIKTFGADAFLQATKTKTLAADAFLQTVQTKTFTADAILSAVNTYTKTFTLDALVGTKVVLPQIILSTEGAVLLNVGKGVVFVKDGKVKSSDIILQRIA